MSSFLGDELSSIFNGTTPFVPNNPPQSYQISYQGGNHGQEKQHPKHLVPLTSALNMGEHYCFDSITDEGMPSMPEPNRRRNTLSAKEKSPLVAAKRHKDYLRKSKFSEKKRRDRIKEKMNILQGLIPNCSKDDTVTMLDKAIMYLVQLKNYVNLHSVNPIMTIQKEALLSSPSGPPEAEASTSYGTRIGTGIGTEGYLPPNFIPFGYYPPIPMCDQEDGHQPSILMTLDMQEDGHQP